MPTDTYFTCTECDSPCTHVTTAYTTEGKSIIGKRERLCNKCFTDRKQTFADVMTMSAEDKRELISSLRQQ